MLNYQQCCNKCNSKYYNMANEKFACKRTALPECPVVAMAYVPFQTDTRVYDDCKALMAGTLFPVLDLPFTGVCCYNG